MTNSTLGISRPLAATSVAMRTFIFPFLNYCNLSNLLAWGISPCRTTFLTFNSDDIYEAIFFVFANIITLPLLEWLFIKCLKAKILLWWVTFTPKCCIVVGAAVYLFILRTILSFCMNFSVKLTTSLFKVAEKHNNWNSGLLFFIFPNISSRCSWKPISNIKSASSTHTVLTSYKFNYPLYIKSRILPGVPTNISGFLCNYFKLRDTGVPPNTVVTLNS